MARNMNFRNWERKLAVATTAAVGWAAVASADSNIEVRIDNVIQSPNALFEFQPIDVGQTVPLIVVIRNIGSTDLVFPSATPISIAGGFVEQFSLIQPPLETGNKLSPNGSTAFRVDFAPTIAESVMGAVASIPTNDPNTPIFNLDLRGIVLVPEMVITLGGQLVAPQTQLNFPPTPIGDVRELELSIVNQGNRPLELTAPLDVFGGFGSDSFSLMQPPLTTVQPGDHAEFVVLFAPTQTGSLTANIGISSNDIGNYAAGRFTFVVRGVGQAAAPGDEGDGSGGSDSADASVDDDGVESTDDGTDPNAAPSDGMNDGTGDAQDASGTSGGAEGFDGGDPNAVDKSDSGAQYDESSYENEMVGPSGMCGFGMPLGMACCLASLATARATRRPRR